MSDKKEWLVIHKHAFRLYPPTEVPSEECRKVRHIAAGDGFLRRTH